jgi:RNA polymerase sigma-70 factor (TIGR02960 family)
MDERLLDRARTGDEAAFRALTEPYRRELQVHCYRILGSVQDAEDLVQETLLAAWRGLGGFEGRASFRAWLYRIATNRCLNVLRDAGRRPQTVPASEPTRPAQTHWAEPTWLEPYPDRLLEELPADPATGPEAVYEAREALSLTFVSALQRLPPQQRAALVLRDVLGFRAAEAGEMLDVSEATVNSALQRARSTVAAGPRAHAERALPSSRRERALVGRFAEAFEEGDVDEVVALLADDGWVRMPPQPHEYQGHEAIRTFLATRPIWAAGRRRRVVATRANGDPALAYYVSEPGEPEAPLSGLFVLTLAADRIAAITRFGLGRTLPFFGLPERVPV